MKHSTSYFQAKSVVMHALDTDCKSEWNPTDIINNELYFSNSIIINYSIIVLSFKVSWIFISFCVLTDHFSVEDNDKLHQNSLAKYQIKPETHVENIIYSDFPFTHIFFVDKQTCGPIKYIIDNKCDLMTGIYLTLLCV